MTTKQELHELVERLDDSGALDRAERYLKGLVAAQSGPAPTDEDAGWMEPDLSDLTNLEPYDWGSLGTQSVRRVSYSPEHGLMWRNDRPRITATRPR